VSADYMTLLGAEDVKAAAHTMQEAAATIRSAVSDLDEVLSRHRQEMREMWVEQQDVTS